MPNQDIEQPISLAKKYRKKPIVVEAFQMIYAFQHTFDPKDTRPMPEWFMDATRKTPGRMGRIFVHANGLWAIETLEGIMEISPNDWVIKGAIGEIYPCKPDAFEASLEPAEVEPSGNISTDETLEAFRALAKHQMNVDKMNAYRWGVQGLLLLDKYRHLMEPVADTEKDIDKEAK